MSLKRKIKNTFSWLAKPFKGLPKPSAETLLIAAVLTFNFIVTLSIRLIPLKYGPYLNEFDPYFQYYQAQWIVDRGWGGFIDWFTQPVNKLFWYPTGRDIPSNAYPGVPFVGAFVYLILKGLGINLPMMYVVGFIPAFSAAITTVLLYFIGKELHSKTAGLIASFFFAVSAATLPRTSYGFFDDDSISQIYIALFILSFLKTIKGNTRIWPFIGGIALGLIVMTWGAFIYVLNLFALTIIIFVVFRRINNDIMKSYLISMTIALIFALIVPRARGYLPSAQMLLVYLAYVAIFAELYLFKILKRITPLRLTVYLASVIGGSIGIAYLLERLGYFHGIVGKFLIVINPFYKSQNPWLESVAEHYATSWAQFFLNFNLMFIMLPFGIYLITKRASNMDIFMIITALTSLHATAATNRLFMLSVQPATIVGAIALASIISSYATIFRPPKEYLERRRARLFKGIPTNYGAILLIVLILITIFTSTAAQTNPLRAASIPQSIISTETGSVTYDWIATFEWIKNNLPQNAVIASWWDYGYWITVNTGRITLADNANFNYTKIYLLARALISDENTSLNILKKFGASYVLVYEGMYNAGGYLIPIGGDLEKSYWMLRIGYNYTDQQVRQWYLNTTTITIGNQQVALTLPVGPKAKDVVLYKMLFLNIPNKRQIYPSILNQINMPAPTYFTLVYQSPNGSVLIFKILYPEKIGNT